MNNYLGAEVVKGIDNPFHNFTHEEWALKYIMAYGGIDGDNHKAWVLDQVARILKGTQVIVKLARWHNPEYFEEPKEAGSYPWAYVDGENNIVGEYRFNTGEPTQLYRDWVLECRGEYDEESGFYEYSYDEGIAP